MTQILFLPICSWGYNKHLQHRIDNKLKYIGNTIKPFSYQCNGNKNTEKFSYCLNAILCL